jgi:predicted amidophosphoribosyltransferase
VIDLSTLDRPPLGFAECRHCAYVRGGSAAICFACSAENTEAPPLEACETCNRPREPGERCANKVCHFDDRYFSRVHAISMREGQMEWAISRFKYQERKGWAAIFGRILVGYLDEHRDLFSGYDAITASPTYMGPGANRSFDHTRMIVEAAGVEDPIDWPFAPCLVVKESPTERFAGKSWRERKQIAEGPLRKALRVPDPGAVEGRRILVFDDIFTNGFTIREVARALLRAGASEVSEVVLARQPFRG